MWSKWHLSTLRTPLRRSTSTKSTSAPKMVFRPRGTGRPRRPRRRRTRRRRRPSATTSSLTWTRTSSSSAATPWTCHPTRMLPASIFSNLITTWMISLSFTCFPALVRRPASCPSDCCKELNKVCLLGLPGARRRCNNPRWFRWRGGGLLYAESIVTYQKFTYSDDLCHLANN